MKETPTIANCRWHGNFLPYPSSYLLWWHFDFFFFTFGLQITSSLSCTEEVGIYLHSTLPVNLHLFCNLHDIHLPYNQCKPPLWVCIQAFIQVTWFDKGWWLIKVSKYPHKCFGFFDDQNFLLLLIRKKVQKIRFKIPCPHDLYF